MACSPRARARSRAPRPVAPISAGATTRPLRAPQSFDRLVPARCPPNLAVPTSLNPPRACREQTGFLARSWTARLVRAVAFEDSAGDDQMKRRLGWIASGVVGPDEHVVAAAGLH